MSELLFIFWNICWLFCDKINFFEFYLIINGYDIIFFSECWFIFGDVIDIDGYEKCIFLRKLIKGGGIVIYCKLYLFLYISIVENIYDYIIWCKILINVENKNIYIVMCYLFFENSVFMNILILIFVYFNYKRS